MTPALRLLESLAIVHRLHRYELDANADSYGLEAAAKLGVEPDRLFKTLVAVIDQERTVLALVPVHVRLDLKKLAEVASGRQAELADPGHAQKCTGYVLGGISPLAGKKRLPTFIDETAQLFETIFVSAGQRGLQIEISPTILQELTGAAWFDLTRSPV